MLCCKYFQDTFSCKILADNCSILFLTSIVSCFIWIFHVTCRLFTVETWRSVTVALSNWRIMLCVMYSKAKIDNPPTDKDSEGILQQNLESMCSFFDGSSWSLNNVIFQWRQIMTCFLSQYLICLLLATLITWLFILWDRGDRICYVTIL